MTDLDAKDIQPAPSEAPKNICGIIMPISAMPPKYDAAHWTDVRRIINEAATKAGMIPQLSVTRLSLTLSSNE